ncbi:methylated-DNA--[protein]-cysteine S-methyltransferase [Roseiterribacter gracilis]|uniref:Methylated-DNA--protein-cysteine methyltransferase n=1 Tax=Roseiterribacter gracilis TaxID=2812848 RepID=A0A8S8XCU0_9PROT|nr:methylated-DNA--protein-cysteine methyltransferase [Rhodospirillales bacterium TMPK1]
MPDARRLFVDRMQTPLGALCVVVDEADRLAAADWIEKEQQLREKFPQLQERNVTVVTDALHAYFHGAFDAIDKLAVATNGTAFQELVWRNLRKIRRGTVTTYAALARRIGRPTATRAVGFANGSNPINIVVPCHRVIGSNGSLTGYGGGLARKQWLLTHEQVTLA